MSDRARLFVSAIRLVRLIVITACITGSAAVSAQAEDRWPPNVCADLAEQMQIEENVWADGRPELLGIARGSLLDLLGQHCDVDVRAKKQIDRNAALAADRAQAARRRHRICTSLDLGNGLSTLDCN